MRAPKTVTKISTTAREIIFFSNLLLLGFRVDLDDLPVDIVTGIEYFGMRRRAIELEEKFKALGKMFGEK